jgi:hypothetical protein
MMMGRVNSRLLPSGLTEAVRGQERLRRAVEGHRREEGKCAMLLGTQAHVQR